MTDDTAETTNKERDAFIQSLGLSYSARFVPQSQSRNAGDKSPSLNWKITIGKGSAQIETDYFQGIWHLPGYRFADKSASYAEYIRRVVESGKYSRTKAAEDLDPVWFIPAPLLRDVLHALTLDADAIDYPTYEEWASNFGFDEDSRKGEAIYRQCLQIGLQLRAMIGDSDLAKLRELFQDY